MKNLRRNRENEMNEFISQKLENQRFFFSKADSHKMKNLRRNRENEMNE